MLHSVTFHHCLSNYWFTDFQYSKGTVRVIQSIFYAKIFNMILRSRSYMYGLRSISA